MAARPQYGQGMKVPVPRRCLPKTQQRVGTLLSPTSYGTDEELWNLLEEVGIIEVGGTMCECGEFVAVGARTGPWARAARCAGRPPTCGTGRSSTGSASSEASSR